MSTRATSPTNTTIHEVQAGLSHAAVPRTTGVRVRKVESNNATVNGWEKAVLTELGFLVQYATRLSVGHSSRWSHPTTTDPLSPAYDSVPFFNKAAVSPWGSLLCTLGIPLAPWAQAPNYKRNYGLLHCFVNDF